MTKSILVNLPIDVLWEFREFKRDEIPAPRISFVTSHSVDEVTDYVEAQGKIDPVELSIIGTQALLTDGNHRILAAKRLGYTSIPVKIVIYFGGGDDVFYDHTLERFLPLSKNLEAFLKKIFLVRSGVSTPR